MTVRELIEELEEYPMDLPVITNYKEITSVELTDGMYYLDGTDSYTYSHAVEVG